MQDAALDSALEGVIGEILAAGGLLGQLSGLVSHVCRDGRWRTLAKVGLAAPLFLITVSSISS